MHADEAVYSKLIKWLNKGLYDKIFPLLGGFHTLLEKLKILHKNYGLLEIKDWWVEINGVAVDSAEKEAEGKDYCRSVRLHKQPFEALVRFKTMSILENLTLHDIFTALNGKVRVDPPQHDQSQL